MGTGAASGWKGIGGKEGYSAAVRTLLFAADITAFAPVFLLRKKRVLSRFFAVRDSGGEGPAEHSTGIPFPGNRGLRQKRTPVPGKEESGRDAGYP